MLLRERIWKLVIAAPLLAPVALAAFGAVTVVCMLAGLWNMYFILAAGLVAAVAASIVVYKFGGYGALSQPSKETKYAALVVVIGVLLWVTINSFFASQNLLMGRDAQIYAENAAWLVNYNTPIFEPSGIFGDLETTGVIEEQTKRMMLLPYLLGIAGELGGFDFMLRINPIFGGVAILAVFAFGRFLMRDRWAAVAAAAFSFILPLIHFSRDNYTEPLAAAFIFASLALIALAWQRKNNILFSIAGLVAGSGMLIRFDSMMPVIGMILAFVLLLMLARKGERKETLTSTVYFSFGMAITVVLGMVNLMVFSWGYYETHADLIWRQFIALGGVVILGFIATGITWRTKLLQWLNSKTLHWRGRAVFGAFVAAVAILASRPLWMTGTKEQFNGLVYSIEVAVGMEPSGYRTYAEHTLNWILWYVGPVLAIGAVIGIAILLYRAMYRRSMVLFLSVTVLLSAAVVYVNVPAITPDQIWASRRFLPVIFPAVILFGAFFLDWLSQRKRLPLGVNSSMLVGVLATLALVAPLFISQPFLHKRTHVPQLSFMTEFCEKLPQDSAVVWVGATATIEMPQPTRTLCGVPSVAKDDLTQRELQQLQESAREHGRQLIIGAFDENAGLHENLPREFTDAGTLTYEDLAYEMMQPPQSLREETRTMLLGSVAKDGTIEKMELKHEAQ